LNKKSHKPFRFKYFSIYQEFAAMKIGTDGILLGAWVNCHNCKSILDIGTGTGVIALMMAQRNENASIDGIEIDDNAIKDASMNFKNSTWSNRLNLIHLDVLKYKTTKKYDLIVCNPPFFNNSLKPHDNSRALARHNDKLNIAEIAKFSSKKISDKGRICLVLPISSLEEVKLIFAKFHLELIRICYVKPKPHKQPHRVLLEFGKQKQSLQKEKITIENEGRHNYTDDYKNLTREFYTIF